MKKIILAIFLALIFVGCKTDFLERTPLSQISPENAFNTESELQLYVNSFYNSLPSGPEIYSEDADNIVKTSLTPEQTGNRTVPLSDGGWIWTDLRNINYFLSNYTKGGLSPAVTNKYVGVAKFFRAYFYFNKMIRFGDVPWYSKVIESNDIENLTKARDPRQLVIDSVIADLDFAIANCNTTVRSDQVTKWTALALKSRICLFEGSFRKYHPEFNLPDADLFWKKSADASKELMSAESYGLYVSTPDKSYGELFSSTSAIPREIILAKKFSTELQVFHNVNDYTITATQGKPGLEKSLVNSYLNKDGSRFTDVTNYQTLQFYDEVQNRDPRLSQTIRTPGYTRIGDNVVKVPEFGSSVTGYQLTKFVTGNGGDGANHSNNDLPLLRYAEVLLNYAEAKAELNELTQNDINISIKLLRDRVGMPNLILETANNTPDPYLGNIYNNVTGANKGIILEIRRERRIELVMEGFRWNDIYRWKLGRLVTNPFKGMYFPGLGQYDLDRNGTIDLVIYEGTKPGGNGPTYLKLGSEIDLENGNNGGNVVVNKNIIKKFNEDRDYLFPLPSQEILLNPNLSQNNLWTP
ncbi:Putative outer membrane protein [Arcticibacter svalbardensis MN12-7]|uniref:Putative outer membrane protein n=1 Tax=Arcticibacter svalbardensis MN12-7 TaxID=1150600 RepID=R9GXH0_9SPHI|nr:RagB/SusD family nutrient uptake outer membrane protein [Arcticibacter svalbardensis]EOR96180.1 Putative outer membrane protein [Arcticibacter svalbardensis MN12-7]